MFKSLNSQRNFHSRKFRKYSGYETDASKSQFLYLLFGNSYLRMFVIRGLSVFSRLSYRQQNIFNFSNKTISLYNDIKRDVLKIFYVP